MLERGKREFSHYLVMPALVLTAVGLLYFIGVSVTGFSVFIQNNSTEFNLGNYTNTVWNGSAIVLSQQNLTGNYTSKIFDAGINSTWKNLTYTGATPTLSGLVVGDAQSDIWKSFNYGSTWSLIKADYNGADANGGTDLEKNSTSFFLLNGQDIWVSNDRGLSWTKVNDDYNGAEGQNGVVLGVDSSGNIYVLDSDEDVWKSTNSGVSWTKVNSTNFNGGNGNVFGLVVNSSDVIFAVDSAADVWKSTDQGVNWILVKDDYNAGAGNNADDMTIDSSNNLYLLDNQDVWKSTDQGVNWIKTNDDFNGAGDSNVGISIYVDQDDNIYVVDGSEDVFISNDGGTVFSRVASDFNGGNGNLFGFNSFREYTNLSIRVMNCSLADCSDGVWQTVNLNSINLVSRYFRYLVNFSTPNSNKSSSLSSVQIGYDVINSAPNLVLVRPQNTTYNYSTFLPLNYSVSDNDGNLDSCWYSVDGGSNTTLSGCTNVTFNVSGDGSHNVKVYANDTLGSINSSTIYFSVLTNSAPTLFLFLPQDILYTTNISLPLNYSVSDNDGNLDSCWYNIDGGSNITLTGCTNTTFNVSSNGVHLVTIYANDTLGLKNQNGTAFTVDATGINLTVIDPVGVKSSRIDIPITYSAIGNNLTCWYNIKTSIGGSVITNTTLSGCLSSVFNVSVDGDYVFNLYSNNTLGSFTSISSLFSVSTSSTGGGSSGGGGSGGGNSGGGSSIVPLRTELFTNEISNILVNSPGVKKITSWKIKNAGTSFLNDCKFSSIGENSNWITHRETKGLAAGEEYDIIFDVDIPIEATSGLHSLGVVIDCQEKTSSKNFFVEITQKQLSFNLLNAQRESSSSVKVDYSIEELFNREQEVELQFLLFDSDNKQVAEVKEIKDISKLSKSDFTTLIPIDETLAGQLTLLINFNSDLYSGFVEESVILDSSISGFTIFDRIGSKDNLISVIFVVLFLVFTFFVVRKIRAHKNNINVKAKEMIRSSRGIKKPLKKKK